MTLEVKKLQPSMAAFLTQHGVKAVAGPGWQAVVCPFHQDTTASASFNEGECRFRCHTCDVVGNVSQILEKFEGQSAEQVAARVAALPSQQTQAVAPSRNAGKLSGSNLAILATTTLQYHDALMEGVSFLNHHRAIDYVRDRGFSRETVERFKLGVVTSNMAPGHEYFVGRLAIPYLTPAGPVGMRFRCLRDHRCKDHGCPKYLGVKGAKSRMFNARTVLTAGDTIAIAEGELDAITLEQCGIPAVGIPGVRNWHDHYPLILEGFEHIRVFGDGDKDGREWNGTMITRLPDATAVDMPDGQDVNGLFVSDGLDTLRSLCNLL